MPKNPREKLTPIPSPRRKGPPEGRSPAGPAGPEVQAEPDLSRIAEGLRPLAWPVDRLQLHPNNPRKHSDAHIEAIAGSLRVNGQVKNLVASTRTEPPTVVCGNGTLRAAQSLNWEMIAVERRLLTEAQENQLAMVDNVLGADPDWDEAVVAELLKDVDTGNDPDVEKLLSELAEDLELIPKDENGNETGKKVTISSEVTCPNCGHKFSG